MRLALAAASLAVSLAAAPAFAAEPWRPPAADSLRLWADEGLAILVASASDTLGPDELRAYDLFDRIARRHFMALGSRRMDGARGVLAVFDTLGVPVEFAQDAELSQFCAITYFHPRFAGHAAVTYLYWFLGEDLKRQKLLLTGGKHLQMDVWWTGNALSPYEAAFLDRRRTGDTRETFFTLLRISRGADFWGVIQSGRRSVDLGGRGPARFVDLNDDAVPEVVSWSESTPDPRFVVDPHLPPLLSERLWQRTDSGFVLFDRRTVPSPFATFVLFLRALTANETATARALVASPAVLTRARALGLGAVSGKQTWQVLEAPGVDRWHQRMSFLYGAPARNKGLDVRMRFDDGHWRVESLTSRALNPAAKP